MAGGGGVMRKLAFPAVMISSSLIFSFSFELMIDLRTVSAEIYSSPHSDSPTGRYSFWMASSSSLISKKQVSGVYTSLMYSAISPSSVRSSRPLQIRAEISSYGRGLPLPLPGCSAAPP